MPKRWSKTLAFAAFTGAIFSCGAQQASNGNSVELTFERDVRPILKTHCFPCHGEGEKLKGNVDLRLRRFMSKQTDSGIVLVPGQPEESLMLKLIRSGEMPKD